MSTAAVDRSGRAHLEAEIEKFFVKRVRLVGGYAFKFVPLVAGTPDRIVFMPGGRTYLVELKQRGLKPSKVQEVWHGRLGEIGHEVVVLDSRQACVDWIRRVVDALGPQDGRPGPRSRTVD